MSTQKRRYLYPEVKELLESKMVFLGGPRQIGKTTLSLDLLNSNLKDPLKDPRYLNWDNPAKRKKILADELPPDSSLIILDEIHKYPRWRNLVKGIYDVHKNESKFLVTGSARLDTLRRGGDSLQGRYHFLRLHPFSLREMSAKPNQSDLEHLLNFGGFPEPLFKGDQKFYRLWQKEWISRVVKEEVTSISALRDLNLLEILAEILPEKVGNPLSIKNLKEDLEVDHKTIVRWLEVFESLFVCFRIPPFHAKKIRAVKKEQKIYLWDWSRVANSGFRFENLVASQLLKYCNLLEDAEGYKMELRYFRDVDSREVDFVVVKDKKPIFAVECKLGKTAISPHLYYLAERTEIPHFYQVHMGTDHYKKNNIEMIPFIEFCKKLEMP